MEKKIKTLIDIAMYFVMFSPVSSFRCLFDLLTQVHFINDIHFVLETSRAH
jgi:hypothetical protein